MITVGKSVEGRTLHAFRSKRGGGSVTMVLGGFHGDEPKSVSVAQKLIELLQAELATKQGGGWFIVPLVNPDGYARRRRRNANRVDLNRNFPTENWGESSRRSRMHGGSSPGSEPETSAIIQAINSVRPARIITIHSISGGRHCNNYDGPGKKLATLMSSHNGYPVTASIGYPTPGSFGTWAGIERAIPTITLELPSLDSPKRCWEDNRRALLAVSELR
jgi:predicted deacylase